MKKNRLIDNYALIFKALSHPKRLQIFLELMVKLESGKKCESDVEKAEACQMEMAKRLDIAPSTLSHHIKELKHAGLITVHRTGRNVSIAINMENVDLLKNFLQDKNTDLQNTFDLFEDNRLFKEKQ